MAWDQSKSYDVAYDQAHWVYTKEVGRGALVDSPMLGAIIPTREQFYTRLHQQDSFQDMEFFFKFAIVGFILVGSTCLMAGILSTHVFWIGAVTSVIGGLFCQLMLKKLSHRRKLYLTQGGAK